MQGYWNRSCSLAIPVCLVNNTLSCLAVNDVNHAFNQINLAAFYQDKRMIDIIDC